MARDGYRKKRVTGKRDFSSGERHSGGRGHSRVKGVLGVRKDASNKKSKIVSIKNQIRSIERLLKKPLLAEEVKDAQEVRLEDLKKQAEQHARSELERKMALRYRRIKFFERRKIERRIRRADKQLRTVGDPTSSAGLALSRELEQLKEDLEYVKFFPKTEKYVALFAGNDDEIVAVRNELRKRIKANIAAAAAAGVELEETGSEDEAIDVSEDDFFMAGSSSDDADADDELTDKSLRLGDDDDVPQQILTQNPKAAVKQKLSKGFDKPSKSSSLSKHSSKYEKPTKSSAGGPSRVNPRPHSKQNRVKPRTPPSSRPSSSTGNSRPSSSAGNSIQSSLTGNSKSMSSFGGNNTQSYFAGNSRASSSAVNTRKPISRPGRTSAHHANILRAALLPYPWVKEVKPHEGDSRLFMEKRTCSFILHHILSLLQSET
ncbi:hypothetical protein R1flu_001785 [Riccia fluitans]|uniref:rRNA-processing protein EFG1 n=1 Tax=Riccia fluitans TaxID=41844 RepID=A0ABD1Y4F2_9MARC